MASQEGGHAGAGDGPTVQQSFLDNALKPFLQHVAASSYKDYVLAYDIMNEPERLLPGGWGPSADFVTVSQMQAFVKNSASYIHMYGGGALATVGSAAQTWMGQGLDFYCAHYNSGPGEPSGLTPPPTYASLGLDKPVVVEEFTTADVSFGLSDTARVVRRMVAEHDLQPGLCRSDRLGVARQRRQLGELPARVHGLGRRPCQRRRAMS